MLLWGAKHGHTQFVRRMLREFNIDVNVRSHKSEASPLHLAAAQGHYDTVRWPSLPLAVCAMLHACQLKLC
jgi:ankyrin repeat protein